ARWLTEPVTSPDFIDDHRYLTDVRDIFGWLREDRKAQTPRFVRLPGERPGPLTAAVPQLRALKTLLADAVRGAPTRVPPADLAGCEWAQWLCDRLQHAGGS